MLHTKTQKHNESTTTKLQGDEHTKDGDSGISGEDSDSIGESVNKFKISSAITKPSKNKKAKTPKNKSNSVGESSKKLEVKEDCVVISKFYHETNKALSKKLLEGIDNTSEKLKECTEKYEELSEIVVDLESKIDSAEGATKSVTTAINNHEKLLKSNCLGLKYRKIIGTVFGVGGLICIGASAANPVAAGTIIPIGVVITLISICGGFNLHKKLYKELNKLCEKPNSTVKNTNIELGVQDQSLLQHSH